MRLARSYRQAMQVALGLYLFGHAADLATVLYLSRLGRPAWGLIPRALLDAGGLPAVIGVKVIGVAVTTWVFWQLRERLLAVVVTCILAVAMLYVASVDLLLILEAVRSGR